MKKLAAILLSVIMLLNVSSFADEGKIYDGVTLKLLGYGFTSSFDAEGNIKDVTDSNLPLWAALLEFAEKTGVKYEHLSGDVASLIAAGEVPDLWNTNNQYPEVCAKGLVEPWDAEWVTKLGEKHGEYWLECMNYAGECYGIAHKWSSLGGLQYNYTKMVELGIKTPREYYLEGEWTWENFFKMLNECVIDVDGDGALEYDGISKNSFNSFLLPDVAIDEEGKVQSLVDTERYRTLHNYIYNAYQTGAIGNHGNGLNGNPTYTLCRWYRFGAYTLGRVNSVGYVVGDDYIDSIMPPRMNAEDTEQSCCVNFVYMFRPAGASQKDAKTVEAAYALVDYMYECEEQFMNIRAGFEAFPFEGEGITGTTPETKEWMEKLMVSLDNDMAITKAHPDYDPEWVVTLAEWYSNAPIHFLNLKIPGVANNGITSNDALNTPTATFISMYAPVHQAQCDAFNLLYAEK